MTRLFSYVLVSDTGFAPAVDKRGRFLTLCTCMMRIRKKARMGDWLLGTVGKKLSRKGCGSELNFKKVVYLAEVTENPVTFGQYCDDADYANQKDRVYSLKAGSLFCDGPYNNGYYSTRENRHRESEVRLKDTETPIALVSKNFYYFGREPLALLPQFSEKFVSHRYSVFDSPAVDDIIGYASQEWHEYKNVWNEPTEEPST